MPVLGIQSKEVKTVHVNRPCSARRLPAWRCRHLLSGIFKKSWSFSLTSPFDAGSTQVAAVSSPVVFTYQASASRRGPSFAFSADATREILGALRTAGRSNAAHHDAEPSGRAGCAAV